MTMWQGSRSVWPTAAFTSATWCPPALRIIVRLVSVIPLVPIFALPLLSHLPAIAQNAPRKDFRFEVLSIRTVGRRLPVRKRGDLAP